MAEHAITKEATDRFTEVDGVSIHYNEAGEGPALLCFHGGGPAPTHGTTRSTTSTPLQSTSGHCWSTCLPTASPTKA